MHPTRIKMFHYPHLLSGAEQWLFTFNSCMLLFETTLMRLNKNKKAADHA